MPLAAMQKRQQQRRGDAPTMRTLRARDAISAGRRLRPEPPVVPFVIELPRRMRRPSRHRAPGARMYRSRNSRSPQPPAARRYRRFQPSPGARRRRARRRATRLQPSRCSPGHATPMHGAPRHASPLPAAGSVERATTANLGSVCRSAAATMRSFRACSRAALALGARSKRESSALASDTRRRAPSSSATRLANRSRSRAGHRVRSAP